MDLLGVGIYRLGESPMIPKGLISENSRVQEICGRIWDDLGGKSCDGFFLKELVDCCFLQNIIFRNL